MNQPSSVYLPKAGDIIISRSMFDCEHEYNLFVAALPPNKAWVIPADATVKKRGIARRLTDAFKSLLN
jgi:hypothetical protein